jgi:hypothetical protein
VKLFIQRNDAAGALLAVTLAGAVLVEWAVTLHERAAGERGLGRRAAVAGRTLREVTLLRTGERREEDLHTKWVLVGSVTAGIGLGLLAAVQLPGSSFRSRVGPRRSSASRSCGPGSGWARGRSWRSAGSSGVNIQVLRSDHSPAGAGSLVVHSRRWEPAQ